VQNFERLGINGGDETVNTKHKQLPVKVKMPSPMNLIAYNLARLAKISFKDYIWCFGFNLNFLKSSCKIYQKVQKPVRPIGSKKEQEC
jgi:hypothetical protein